MRFQDSTGFFCQTPKEVTGFLTNNVQSSETSEYVQLSSFSGLSLAFLSSQKSSGTALIDTAAQHGLVGLETLINF